MVRWLAALETTLDLLLYIDKYLVQGGILALDLELGKENIVYTAGVDHTGQVFDTRNKRVVASLTGHSKKLTGQYSTYMAI